MSKNTPQINGLIHPTVADYDPKSLDLTDLPFVQNKGKGKKKRCSFWEVKSTGNFALDTSVGRACAVELMQYMMMKPNSSWVFSRVVEALGKKGKTTRVEGSFMTTIAELAIVGANARAKGLQVGTAVEEEVKR